MSLKQLLDSNYFSLEEIEKGLDSFRNTKDKDIEEFPREKALMYEKRKWCSTYLLVDNE